MIMRHLVALLALVAASLPAAAQEAAPKQDRRPVEEPAPLGLAWGLSQSEVRALGVELKDEPGQIGVLVSARNLPKAVSDAANVYLFFGYDDRLWRVFIGSKPFENDRYGSSAMSRFDELSTLLTERYGKARSFSQRPRDDHFSKPENFAYSLFKNERNHGNLWETKNTSIELSLRAANMDDVYFALAYEYKPLAEVARKGKAGREKDAL